MNGMHDVYTLISVLVPQTFEFELEGNLIINNE